MPVDWIRGIAQRGGLLLARLPARCEVCREWPARPVCAPCARRFARPVARCSRCALRLPADPDGLPGPCARCREAPPPLDACIAALDYGYPWDGLVARFKFHGEPGWAAPFAGLMRAAPGAAALLARADRVLPLPLAPGRLARRGYNQALELARHLAPGRLDTASLLRVRDTAPQARLDRDGRLRNVAGAFAVAPGAEPALRGRSLMLVDDVMTSGATLGAAAQALRQAGARRVCALVLARTDDA
jgi:ComF family protein